MYFTWKHSWYFTSHLPKPFLLPLQSISSLIPWHLISPERNLRDLWFSKKKKGSFFASSSPIFINFLSEVQEIRTQKTSFCSWDNQFLVSLGISLLSIDFFSVIEVRFFKAYLSLPIPLVYFLLKFASCDRESTGLVRGNWASHVPSADPCATAGPPTTSSRSLLLVLSATSFDYFTIFCFHHLYIQ